MPPVRNAAVYGLSSSTVRIVWEPPGTGLQVVSCTYVVIVRNLSVPTEPERTVEPSETLACVIEGLTPDSDYEFSIKSVGVLTSQVSIVKVAHRTFEHLPFDAPRNVAVSFDMFIQDTASKGRALAQVIVKWEPPLKPNGKLLGFRVSHRQVGAPSSTPATVSVIQGGAQRELRLNLVPYEHHDIRVLAFNKVGDGPWSEPHRIQTGTNVKRDTLARQPKKQAEPVPEPEPSWVRPQTTPQEVEALSNRAELNLQAIQFKGLMRSAADATMQQDATSKVTPSPKTPSRTPSVQRPAATLQSVSSPAPAARADNTANADASGNGDEKEDDEDDDDLADQGSRPFVVSAKGTVRGVKDRVRQQLVHLHEKREVDTHGLPVEPDLYCDRKGRVVVYTSSCQAIRHTYEQCQVVCRIFYGLRFKVDMRDTFVSDRFNHELQQRLPHISDVRAPQVFIFGKHIGGYKEIFEMNERRELAPLLSSIGIERVVDMSVCRTCGSSGFVPCWWCQGDKKSVATMFDTTLRCTICEASGLVRCFDCTDEKLPADPPV
jgi:glutaredoxin-related protein